MQHLVDNFVASRNEQCSCCRDAAALHILVRNMSFFKSFRHKKFEFENVEVVFQYALLIVVPNNPRNLSLFIVGGKATM